MDEKEHTGTLVETSSNPMFDLQAAEINQQIATAKRYPRDITHFRNEARGMATLTEAIAGQCFYALPRGGKVIEGPSARLAEIVASSWGNCRAGARVMSEDAEFVTAQGVFYDLQRNVGITYEVKRRITDRNGRRYDADMIGVTANAACSIALRNAVFKGVPRAYWEDIYLAARKTAVGDMKSIANKRADAIKAFAAFNINEAMILKKLGRSGIADISVDDLVLLVGMFNAIRDGDTTPEQLFAEEKPASVPTDNGGGPRSTKAQAQSVKDRVKANLPKKAEPPPQDPPQQGDPQPGSDDPTAMFT